MSSKETPSSFHNIICAFVLKIPELEQTANISPRSGSDVASKSRPLSFYSVSVIIILLEYTSLIRVD